MWWVVVTAWAAAPGEACWDTLLKAHVRDGVVDYPALRGPARPALDACLAEQVAVTSHAGWTDAERMAWWINVYNAWTVRLIVDHPEVASIRELGGLLSSPWKQPLIPLAGLRGATMSLDDVEHGVLRSPLTEPRVHVALVCASISCPALRAEAYTAARLDAQLADQARAFLADPTKNRVEDGQLRVSKIFDWYGADFAAVGGVRGFLRAWGPPAMAAVAGAAPVTFLPYDWGLNGPRSAR